MGTAEKNDKRTAISRLEEQDLKTLMQQVRQGVSFEDFQEVVKQSPFTLTEWSEILHIEKRYLQRNHQFDSLHSEKILEIVLLLKKGIEVFENKELFHDWLRTPHMALDGVKPIALLDNTFGINHVKAELTKIEHGILA